MSSTLAEGRGEAADVLTNRTYDEIAVGDSASLEHTISRDDIALFALVTGDANPTHVDPEYAASPGKKGLTAHSLLGGSLLSALLGDRLPGPGTVYRRQAFDFLKPPMQGDTLHVEIVAKEKQAGGIVAFDCRATNQHGETLFTGRAEVIAPTEKISRVRAALPKVGLKRHDKWNRLTALAKSLDPLPTCVVYPCDESSLRAAVEAADEGIIEPIVVGPLERIEAVAANAGINVLRFECIDVPDAEAAAQAAVVRVNQGAQALMKGSLHTDELLKAVVAKDSGLRGSRRMSHCFVMDVPGHDDVLIVTDAAVNIAPTLDVKADIVQNAIELARALGIEPRVAILSAVETVNPKMQSTVDAAALKHMAERGQITGGLVDGPFAFDNAINLDAARIKGITSPVAGRANVLVVPDIEAGNMLAKNLTFMADADAAGIVLGALVPIVLTSRADSVLTRLASAALAALVVHHTSVAL
jgi:phosphotransacetylase/acyl dehydratase